MSGYKSIKICLNLDDISGSEIFGFLKKTFEILQKKPSRNKP